MKRIALSVFTIALTLVAVVPGRGQSQVASGMQDSGPYVFGKDIYEFTVTPSGSGMIYKFDGPNKTVVGVIMQSQVSGFGGKPLGDAGNAYNEWAKTHGGTSVTVVAPQPSTPSQPDVGATGGGGEQRKAAAIGWDEATKTVTLPTGWSVTSVDDNNAIVHPPGSGNGGVTNMEYDLVKHGKSAGSFIGSYVANTRGSTGGSVFGDGVKILVKFQGGVPAEMYDTGNGAQSSRQLPTGIVEAVRDATKVAPSSFGSTAVFKSLLANRAGL